MREKIPGQPAPVRRTGKVEKCSGNERCGKVERESSVV